VAKRARMSARTDQHLSEANTTVWPYDVDQAHNPAARVPPSANASHDAPCWITSREPSSGRCTASSGR